MDKIGVAVVEDDEIYFTVADVDEEAIRQMPKPSSVQRPAANPAAGSIRRSRAGQGTGDVDAKPDDFHGCERDPAQRRIRDIDATGTDAAPNTAYTIDISGPISLTTDFLAINLESRSSLTMAGTNGSGGTQVQTIGGNGSERGSFVYAGNVTLENLTIENATAAGGSGSLGGGGAGLGGGLFGRLRRRGEISRVRSRSLQRHQRVGNCDGGRRPRAPPRRAPIWGSDGR